MTRLFAAFFSLYLSYAGAEPFNVVSMGDSITTGFNSRWPYDFGNGRYSWATGFSTSIASHLNRLHGTVDRQIEFQNVAKAGTISIELAEQLQAITFQRVDYLTLLVGSNDVCDWQADHRRNLQSFKRNISYILDLLIKKHQQIKITLSAIPDMHHLYTIGQKKCHLKWNLLNVCSRLLHSKRSPEERQLFNRQVIDANLALQELATTYHRHVRFVAEVFDFKFATKHTSGLDCFHPSVQGQSELARITWGNGWFAK